MALGRSRSRSLTYGKYQTYSRYCFSPSAGMTDSDGSRSVTQTIFLAPRRSSVAMSASASRSNLRAQLSKLARSFSHSELWPRPMIDRLADRRAGRRDLGVGVVEHPRRRGAVVDEVAAGLQLGRDLSSAPEQHRVADHRHRALPAALAVVGGAGGSVVATAPSVVTRRVRPSAACRGRDRRRRCRRGARRRRDRALADQLVEAGRAGRADGVDGDEEQPGRPGEGDRSGAPARALAALEPLAPPG